MAKDPAFTFVESDWFTPRTYNRNGKYPPPLPGVYMWVLSILSDDLKSVHHEILYVGSTRNLLKRYNHHEKGVVFRELYGADVRFYFKETYDYYETEKKLIRATGARFNVQWR